MNWLMAYIAIGILIDIGVAWNNKTIGKEHGLGVTLWFIGAWPAITVLALAGIIKKGRDKNG